MKLLPKHLVTLGALGISALASSAHAGGFALIEQGASGLGNAYAGAGAVASDASTVWFNPAGITELPARELAVAGHAISANTKFTDQGTILNQQLGGSPLSGPDTAEPGGTTIVPNFYYIAPINDKLSYGLGISVPFGSSTEYDVDWKGRYTTVKSAVNAIDINPVLAYRVSDKFRIGGGISIQTLSAELEQAVDSGGVCLATAGAADPAICLNAGLAPGVQTNDGYGAISGDSTAISFNFGMLFLPTPETRIGVAYRAETSHELDGDADFTTDPTLQTFLTAGGSSLFSDTGIKGEIDLPASLSFSVAHKMNDKLELLGDATWTGWSSFKQLLIEYDNAEQPDTLSIQDWDDVWRVSAGLNYQLNEKVTLRAGLAFDQEAIPSPQRRTARIPGNDRTWIAIGAGYALNKNASLDFGFTHLSLDETPIDNAAPESRGAPTVRGNYDASVNIVSAQFSWKFN
ncbi:MAG: outer membrane protein transport protein [Granulosicoccaceae bacterium]